MTGAVTLRYDGRETRLDDAVTRGGDLWLRIDDLSRASGRELKPEGACLGDVCVPLPAGQLDRLVAGGRFNLAELARLLEMPVVVDRPHRDVVP